MDYEALLKEAEKEGLLVKEKPLKYNNGRIKGDRIAIRQDISTSVEKSCVLAEELGHHYTSCGNILNQDDVGNRKQEQRARLWAYDKQIGLSGIIRCYERKCQNKSEMAEYLGVTEDFLEDALYTYKCKYSPMVVVGDYMVYFEPVIGVMKMR